MAYLTVGKENSDTTGIYYEDHGTGAPVVLIHGYPLSGSSWEKQLPVLLDAGRRVITYDRRGFGKSSQPTTGYDYDTMTADLKSLMDELDLREVTLVGFSMGTGEVTRYLGSFGSDRVARAALVAPIPPFLLEADDNPKGLPQSLFDGFMERATKDRYAWLKFFLDNFFNVDELRGTRVSDEVWNACFEVAVDASAYATLACIPSWLTDFRADLSKIDVPLLVIQGTEDRILPIEATGRRIPELVRDLTYIEIPGGPHNVGWTHADEVNAALVDFVT